MGALREQGRRIMDMTGVRFGQQPQPTPPEHADVTTLNGVVTELMSGGGRILRRVKPGSLLEVSRKIRLDGSTKTEHFTVNQGVVFLRPEDMNDEYGNLRFLAAAVGTFAGDKHPTLVGGIHTPAWNFWGLQKRFLDPDGTSSLINAAELPLMRPPHLVFRIEESRGDLITVTTGNDIKDMNWFPRDELTNPETELITRRAIVDLVMFPKSQ